MSTGSNPSPPPKNFIGWQDKILLKLIYKPFNRPNSYNASILYSEQVGKYLQESPIKGLIKYLYPFINFIKIIVRIFII